MKDPRRVVKHAKSAMRKPTSTSLSALLPLAALVTASACQPDAASPPDPFASTPWTLSDRETTIGSVDDPEHVFGPIAHMALGPDGLLYSTHAGEGQVRRWTADGAPAGVLGRRGEGPGEFQYPYQLGFHGDSLWVWDVLANRASYFDLAGRFLGSASSRPNAGSGGDPFLRPVAPLRDGTFLGLTPPMSTAIASGELTETPYMRMDREGRGLGLIWTQRWERRDVFGGSSLSLPFGDADLSGFGKRGLLVGERRVWTGDGDAVVRISEIDFNGDTIFTATVPYEPVPLVAERFDSVVTAWIEDAGRGAARGAELEAAYRPAYLPAVRNVVAAEDGTIWLQRFDPVVSEAGENVHEWWVLDSEGNPVTQALTPVDLEVKVITDDAVWGIVRDDLDVEYIVRHRLIKGG